MPTDRPRKLLDQVREAIQRKHYSPRTAESYVHWIKRFIFFHHKRHPNELDEPEIEALLTLLAVEEHVAASTQNQALSALLFLYRVVLKREIDLPGNALRAQKPQRLPAVLSRDEVRRILSLMTGTHQLVARLLYGSGLRLMECVRPPARRPRRAQPPRSTMNARTHVAPPIRSRFTNRTTCAIMYPVLVISARRRSSSHFH